MASQEGLLSLLKRKKLLLPSLGLLLATTAAEILILHWHLAKTTQSVLDRRRTCNRCREEFVNISRSSGCVALSAGRNVHANLNCAYFLCKEYLSNSEKYLFRTCLYETTHPRLNELSEGPFVELTPMHTA